MAALRPVAGKLGNGPRLDGRPAPLAGLEQAISRVRKAAGGPDAPTPHLTTGDALRLLGRLVDSLGPVDLLGALSAVLLAQAFPHEGVTPLRLDDADQQANRISSALDAIVDQEEDLRLRQEERRLG